MAPRLSSCLTLLGCLLCLSLLSAVHAQVSPFASQITAKYQSGQVVSNIESKMPSRSDTTYNLTNQSYIEGLVALGIAGIVLGVVSAVSFMIFGCCRCCNRCKPSAFGPRTTSLVIALVSIVVVVAFCIVGLVLNNTASSAISGDNGIANQGVTLLNNVIANTGSYSTLLGNLTTTVNVVVPTIQAQMNAILPTLSTGVNGVEYTLNNEASYLNQQQLVVYPADPGDPKFNTPITYTCSLCTSTAQTFTSLSSNIASNTAPFFSTAQSTINTVQNTIVSIKTGVTTAVTQAQTSLQSVHDSAVGKQDLTNNASTQVKNGDTNRHWVMILFFTIPLVSAVLIFFGSFFSSKRLFGWSYVLLMIVVPLIFVTFGVHMSVTAFNADSCQYFDGTEINLRSYFSTTTVNVLEACMLGNSLLVALNVDQYVALVNNVTFPTVQNPNSFINVTQLNELQTQINSLTIAQLGYNATQTQDSLNQLNTLTNGYFTYQNVSSCNYLNYPPAAVQAQVRTLRNVVLTSLNATTALNSSLTRFQANFTVVYNNITGLITQTNTLVNEINGLQAQVAPLQAVGNELVAQAFCSVEGNNYLTLKEDLCGNNADTGKDSSSTAYSLGILTLACFFTSIFGLICIIALIFVEARTGPKDDDDKGDNYIIKGESVKSAPLNDLQPAAIAMQVEPPRYEAITVEGASGGGEFKKNTEGGNETV